MWAEFFPEFSTPPGVTPGTRLFLHWANVKGLRPWTGLLFQQGECKKYVGSGGNVYVLTADFSNLGNIIFQWEAKTK